MNLKEVVFIFSAELKNNKANEARHVSLVKALKRNSISHVETIGAFRHVSETSIIATGLSHYEKIRELCQMFDQECFLVSYSDRSSYLVDCATGNETYIGKLVPVSQDEAHQIGNYTKCPVSGQYWTCVK